MLRFFEGTGGITGTNLQVGTAHRIDLSLGPQGARIYLDGAELPAAAIPANTNGWNNGRVKYLGRWTDGVQAPAVGVFDRLRIWNRQLTGAEIAELEPAQSISLPDEQGEPVAGRRGTVGAVAGRMAAERRADPTADQVRLQPEPRQRQRARARPTPRRCRRRSTAPRRARLLLAVCQTPGTIEFWNYPNGLSFPSGSAGNYITLQARQGDGVVISARRGFLGRAHAEQRLLDAERAQPGRHRQAHLALGRHVPGRRTDA